MKLQFLVTVEVEGVLTPHLRTVLAAEIHSNLESLSPSNFQYDDVTLSSVQLYDVTPSIGTFNSEA
jgi:hypothetical protein